MYQAAPEAIKGTGQQQFFQGLFITLNFFMFFFMCQFCPYVYSSTNTNKEAEDWGGVGCSRATGLLLMIYVKAHGRVVFCYSFSFHTLPLPN